MRLVIRFHLLLLVSLLAITFLASVSAHAQDRTYITSEFTGRHFGRMADHGGLIGAAVPDTARASAFDMVRLDGNRLAFRDLASGDYLRAGVGQGTHLMVASPHIRGWETFEMVGLPGAVALRSIQNGRYLTVEPGPAGLVSATADRIGPRERFLLSTMQAPRTPPLAEGRLRIPFSYVIDLDRGALADWDSRRGDLHVSATGGGRVELATPFGTQIGPVTDVPLTVDGCRTRGFRSGPLEVTPAMIGRHVCVLTTEFNIASVQITDMSLTRPGYVELAYVTRR